MAAGLNVCRASQWTGFPSTGVRNSEPLFGAMTGFPPDGRVKASIWHATALSAETAAAKTPAAIRTNIDERCIGRTIPIGSRQASGRVNGVAASRLVHGHIVGHPRRGQER